MIPEHSHTASLSAALAGILVLASSPVAAADLMGGGYRSPQPQYYDDTEEVEIVPMASSWYLRGDVGVTVATKPDIRINYYPDSPAAMLNESSDTTSTMGLGFGYQFEGGFRADVTVDYTFPVRYTAKRPDSVDITREPGITDPKRRSGDYYPNFQTRRQTVAMLVNGYYEFSLGGGFRPYLGAGIGAAVTDVYSTYYLDPYFGNAAKSDEYGFPNQSVLGRGNQARHTSKTLAWALMVGAAYQINDRWSLDVGYRYLHIGNVRSGGTEAVDLHGSGAWDVDNETEPRIKFNNYAYIDDIAEHQVRIGVRYTFDE
ncbi:MAG: acyloxyacyl hydrolase [Methylobacteriaceae bacterium]|jgi:opacity protein-like surface antigen|nr:acyloxyacyl hydrolase [Methylobacteriaceae bacterium]